MKATIIFGVILVALGIAGFAMGGFSFTHETKDVELGPVQIEHQQRKTIPIPPALSAIAIVSGAGLVVIGLRSKQA